MSAQPKTLRIGCAGNARSDVAGENKTSLPDDMGLLLLPACGLRLPIAVGLHLEPWAGRDRHGARGFSRPSTLGSRALGSSTPSSISGTKTVRATGCIESRSEKSDGFGVVSRSTVTGVEDKDGVQGEVVAAWPVAAPVAWLSRSFNSCSSSGVKSDP